MECLSVIELLFFFEEKKWKRKDVNKAKRVETINILTLSGRGKGRFIPQI